MPARTIAEVLADLDVLEIAQQGSQYRWAIERLNYEAALVRAWPTLREAARDAERYRWLRSRRRYAEVPSHLYVRDFYEADMDRLIDNQLSALAAQQVREGEAG